MEATELQAFEGRRVPAVTFKTRVRDVSIGGDNPFVWQHLTTDELFGGRRVVVFSLPVRSRPPARTSSVPRMSVTLTSLLRPVSTRSSALP